MEQHPEQPGERSSEHLDAAATAAPERHNGNLTLSEAARLTGASRNRLYRAVEAGKLTRQADGSLSVQQLLDAGFTFKNEPNATVPNDNLGHLLAAYTDLSRELNESLRDQNDTLREHCAMLQEQVRLLQDQLQASQQREAQLLQLVQADRAEAVPQQHVRNDATPDATPDVAAQTHIIPLDNETPVTEPQNIPQQAHPAPPADGQAGAAASQQPPPVESAAQSSSLFKRWKT